MRNSISVLAVLLFTACSSLPSSYEEPPKSIRGELASIDKFGSGSSFCGITANPICNARVNLVDGKQAGFFASSVTIEPGNHRLELACASRTERTFPAVRGFRRTFDINIPPGAKYRVHATWIDDACLVSLVESETGREVPVRDIVYVPPTLNEAKP